MKKIFWLLFTGVFAGSTFSTPANAASKTFYLGSGALFYNMSKVTSTDTADISLIGQIYIPLTLTANFSMGTGAHLETVIGYTPLGVTAADSVKKTIITLGSRYAQHLSPIFDFKGGLGVLFYSISGDGSTVTRNNGGSTATFYLPGSSQTSKSVYLDVGFGYLIGNDFKIDLDAMVVGAFSDRRAISSILTVSKGIF